MSPVLCYLHEVNTRSLVVTAGAGAQRAWVVQCKRRSLSLSLNWGAEAGIARHRGHALLRPASHLHWGFTGAVLKLEQPCNMPKMSCKSLYDLRNNPFSWSAPAQAV